MEIETTYAWNVTIPDEDIHTYVATSAYVTNHGALVVGQLDDNNECLAPVAMYSPFGWTSCLRGEELEVIS